MKMIMTTKTTKEMMKKVMNRKEDIRAERKTVSASTTRVWHSEDRALTARDTGPKMR